jgi:hypothetical protein
MTVDFKRLIPHAIAVAVFAIISMAYFIPQLSGKKLNQSDIVSFKAVSKEIVDHRETYGEEPLWTNSLFGGMPAYQVSMRDNSNLLKHVRTVLYLGFKHPIGTFIFGMLGMYILLLTLRVNPYLAIAGSVLYTMGTMHLVLLEAGHNSKVTTLFSCAPIIAAVLLTYRGSLLKGGLLFAAAMGINLYCNHPQMTYYLGLALVPLVIAFLARAIKGGDIATFVKASGILLVGLLLAVGSNYARISTTLEYAEDTMRGKPVLEPKGSTASSSEVEGLAYDYAMQWSNGGSDLLATWMPEVVGGATAGFVDKDSPYGKIMRARSDVQTYTYFGGLSSTAGPAYFGAITCFLFVLFLFTGTGIVRWWSLGAVAFLFLISMGSNAGWLNKILFEALPFFNKFRAHSSIMPVAGILVSMAGILGLSQLIDRSEDRASAMRPAMIGTGVFAGLTLLVAMLGPSLIDLTSAYDSQFAQNPQVLDALLDTRADMVRDSALRSLLFIVLAAGFIFAFLKEKIGRSILIAAIAILGLADLIPVDKTYLNEDNWVTQRSSKQQFAPRPVDAQILQDTDPHYRVLDTRQFNGPMPSYHHKHVGGYHAAKLQRYEDLKNRYLISSTGQTIMDMSVINMLNTKYIIAYDGQGQPSAQRNTAAAGNAWFVDEVKVAISANEELASLDGFDPNLVAIVHQEFKPYVSNLNPSKQGSIQLTSYKANELTYTSSSTAEGLAVFSEIWYGPDKGWQAYIDGQAVDHIRANYVLRALRVPAGQHEIRFEFKPSSYSTGRIVGLLSSMIIILGGLLITLKGYLPSIKA